MEMSKAPVTFSTYEEITKYNYDGPVPVINPGNPPIYPEMSVKKTRKGNSGLKIEVLLKNLPDIQGEIRLTDDNIHIIKIAIQLHETEKKKVVC